MTERREIVFRPAKKDVIDDATPDVTDAIDGITSLEDYDAHLKSVERGRTLGRRLMVGIAAVSVAFSMFHSQRVTGDPFALIKETVAHPLSVDGVSPRSDNPAWTSVNRAIYDKHNYMDDFISINTGEKRVEDAKRYGFKVVDCDPYIDLVYQSETSAEVVSHIQKFFSKYDMSFVVPDDFLDVPEDTATKSAERLSRLKEHASSLIIQISLKPVEMIHLSGVETIKVVHDDSDRVHTYDPSDGTCYISVTDITNKDAGNFNPTIDAQIAAGLDYSINGRYGALQDTVYERANGSIQFNATPESHDLSVCHEEKIKFYAKNINGLDAYLVFNGRARSELLLVRLEDRLPGAIGYLRSKSTNDQPVWQKCANPYSAAD